jgi:hypothetical protein
MNIFLFGIQMLITTDHSAPKVANTVLFACCKAPTSGQERPNVSSYQFSDDIDRKSSGEFPQLEPHPLASVCVFSNSL